MRYYSAYPLSEGLDEAAAKAVEARTTPMIADIVFGYLNLARDPTIYAVRGAGEVSSAPDRAPDESLGGIDIFVPRNDDELYSWILRSIDPYDGFWCPLRSRKNCRAVLYGYDGQAHICLRTDDPPPISPDGLLVAIKDLSSELISSDWFDGVEDIDPELQDE